MNVQIKDITIPYIIIKEPQGYLAISPSLDIASGGNSISKAKMMFEEAAKLFIEGLIELGTLNKVLEECGWKKIQGKWKIQEEKTVIATKRKTQLLAHA